jgi:hypothetical protein
LSTTRAARSGAGVGAEGSAGFHRKGVGGRRTERCRACCVSLPDTSGAKWRRQRERSETRSSRQISNS